MTNLELGIWYFGYEPSKTDSKTYIGWIDSNGERYYINEWSPDTNPAQLDLLENKLISVLEQRYKGMGGYLSIQINYQEKIKYTYYYIFDDTSWEIHEGNGPTKLKAKFRAILEGIRYDQK